MPLFNPDLTWPEDIERKCNNYMCKCVNCKETFTGHKRRHICFSCGTKNIIAWNALTPEQQRIETENHARKICALFERIK